MIIKQISNRGAGNVTTRIANLAAYIRSPGEGEKCVYSGARGFLSGADVAEMQALALVSRSADPVDHYVLSWREGEQPTPEHVERSVDLLLESLGMSRHQCIYGLHSDTDNLHLHVMLNRVDPLTEKTVHVEFKHRELAKACARIEHALGFEPEQGAQFLVVDGQLVEVRATDQAPAKLPARVKDIERLTGEKSALRIAQEQAAPVLKGARTWQQLHADLGALGMRYERKGSGAVLFVGDQPVKASDIGSSYGLSKMVKRLGEYQPPAPGTAIAPAPAPQPVNDVARDLGFSQYAAARCEHRAQQQAARLELERAIQIERKALFERQKAERQSVLRPLYGKVPGAVLNAMRSTLAFDQAKARAQLQEKHKKQREQLRQRFPDFEQWVLQQRGPGSAERYRHAAAIAEIHGASKEPATPCDIRAYTAVQRGSTVLYSRAGLDGLVDFVDHGPRIAFLNRSDDAVLAGLQLSQQRFGKSLTLYGDDDFKRQAIRLAVAHGITIANPELQEAIAAEKERQKMERLEAYKTPVQKDFEAYHKAIGADTYRVISRSESGKVWVMGKNPDGTILGFSPDKMPWRKLQELADKNSEHIYYTPLSRTHHIILVDDTTPDKIEAMKRAGIEPALVQQTSPHSWQAFIKIPRLEPVSEPHLEPQRQSLEYRASVKLAQELNDRYGDENVSNAVQPGRAPGTPNPKPKHRRPDGTFPKVRILEASGRACEQLQEQLRAYMQEIGQKEQQARQVQVREASREHPMEERGLCHDADIVTRLYATFKKDIEKKILKGPAKDMSTLDYMVALRLRAVGYNERETARIIEQGTDKNGRHHDWSDYADRTAKVVFGIKGTMDLQKYGSYVEKWQKLADKVREPEALKQEPQKRQKEPQKNQEISFGPV
jgi:hypothetical protein